MKPFPIISRSILSSSIKSFDWKGSDPDDAIGEINEEYIEEFNKISSVACVAYIISCTEWIYYFVRDNFDSVEQKNYEQCISAYWVWICELPRKMPPYFKDTENLSLQDISVYAEAVEISIESIQNGICSVPDAETSIDAAFVTQLCEYLLPNECEFSIWKDIVLNRLREKFPVDSEKYDRIRVPRSIFDTDISIIDVNINVDCTSLITEECLNSNDYLPLKRPYDG
jgi:hypothetical protein